MLAPRPGAWSPGPLRSLVLILCVLLVSGSEDEEGINAEVLSRAIADMQRFYGLPVTGEMDPATIRAMRRPRCGVPDRRPEELQEELQMEVHQGSRRRRYTLTGQQWDKDHLTYSLLKQQIPASLGEEHTSAALRKAFDVWSQATPLTFQEVPAHDNNNNNGVVSGNGSSPVPLADILLLFASGHALGLEHSDHPEAVMAPFYRWTSTHNFTLSPDDRAAIQYIYVARAVFRPRRPHHETSALIGRTRSPTAPPLAPLRRRRSPPLASRRDPPAPRHVAHHHHHHHHHHTTTTRPPPITRTPDLRPPPRPTVPEAEPQPVTPAIRPDDRQPPPPRPPPAPPRPPKRPDHLAPDICDGNFDSVTVLRGEMFVFKPLREYGRGLPHDHIDTVIWWEPNEHTYFFKGDRYWRYHEETRKTDQDFPKALSRWGKIPSSPRGVFLSDDGGVYKCLQVVVVVLVVLLVLVVVVVVGSPGAHTYFYKGSSYWRFDNRRGAADAGYPRSILRDFMGCRNAPDPGPDAETTPLAPPPDKPRDRDPTRGGTDTTDDGGRGGGEVEEMEEEDEDEVVELEEGVVVRVPEDDSSRAMSLVMVVVPLVLVGSSYWRFDNRRGAADAGYPRSILRDFMGCRNAPDPAPDAETTPLAPPPDKPRDRDPTRGGTDTTDDGGRGGGEVEEMEEEDEDEVVELEEGVVVRVPEDDSSRAMSLVMVVVPLVLVPASLASQPASLPGAGGRGPGVGAVLRLQLCSRLSLT
ncbi:hypothetical protein CRUP_034458 [Coryphaenoides rupestris]|nr:hypothetical protein CRUP_034458 [Coryphaenoides rupestris]